MTAHWSIGEVLALLQADFPEVTISKIRFLESQGLIDPERTPSGYRRFYEHDFDRLRWILLQQRDHYLPLKVIRERIESGDVPSAAEIEAELAGDEAALRASVAVRTLDGRPADVVDETPPADHDPGAARVDFEEVAELFATELMTDVEPPATPPRLLADPPLPPPPGRPSGPVDTDALWAALEGTIGQALDHEDDAELPDPDAVGGYTADELAVAAGCDIAFVTDLERYGLLRGRSEGREVVFNDDAITMIHLALRFADHGLQPRHLKAFRLGAEREVGLLAQVIDPSLRRRSAAARQQAEAELVQLAADAQALHTLLMQQLLDEEFPHRGR